MIVTMRYGNIVKATKITVKDGLFVIETKEGQKLLNKNDLLEVEDESKSD